MAQQKENNTWLYVAGGLGLTVGAFYLFSRGKRNDPPPPPNTPDLVTQTGQTTEKKLVFNGVTANRFPSEWRSVADTIHTALKFSMIDDNKALAESRLKAPLNIADVRSLIIEYGNRQRHRFGLPDGGKENLAETINRELSAAAIARINAWYRGRNINFAW